MFLRCNNVLLEDYFVGLKQILETNESFEHF